MTSFFVNSDGATASPPTPQLGHFKRSCDACGRTWGPTRCSDPKCSSAAFTDTYIEVTWLERVGGVIKAVVMPPSEKVKPADPADAAALRGLAAAGRAYADALVAADRAARQIVRAEQGTSETTGYVQYTLSVAVDRVSDFAMTNLGQIYKPVLALTKMIETALDRLEQEVNAK